MTNLLCLISPICLVLMLALEVRDWLARRKRVKAFMKESPIPVWVQKRDSQIVYMKMPQPDNNEDDVH